MMRNKGFTLIELLIVMAILGVLAVVVLVAINPVQQLARTRDAGRKSAVAQVGRALEAFYTSHGGRYLIPTNCDTDGGSVSLGPDWMNCLKDSGEISAPAAAIAYNSSLVTMTCPNTAQIIGGVSHVCQNNLWYTVTNTGATPVVYTRLESATETSKCDDPSTAPVPYFVWSTVNGRGGLICLATGTVPAPAGINNWNSQQ